VYQGQHHYGFWIYNGSGRQYLQPLLARISQTLLDQSKPPQAINPAAAEAPGTGNYGFSGGYSVAMKSVELTKKGKETISFAVRTVV